jgi:hypothetical protein
MGDCKGRRSLRQRKKRFDKDQPIKVKEVIRKYRDWFLTGTEPRKIGRYIVDPRRLRDHIHELRGFNHACCRPGLPCHADFLLEQANQPKPTLQMWQRNLITHTVQAFLDQVPSSRDHEIIGVSLVRGLDKILYSGLRHPFF